MKKTPYVIPAGQCRLGDIVVPTILDSPREGYSDSTVINITDKGVTLCRPYVHTSDFTCTSGVLRYLGWEEYTLYPSSEVTVLRESSVTEVINTETDPERLERSGIARRRREGTDLPEYRNKWQSTADHARLDDIVRSGPAK